MLDLLVYRCFGANEGEVVYDNDKREIKVNKGIKLSSFVCNGTYIMKARNKTVNLLRVKGAQCKLCVKVQNLKTMDAIHV